MWDIGQSYKKRDKDKILSFGFFSFIIPVEIRFLFDFRSVCVSSFLTRSRQVQLAGTAV